ncbi:MAG: diacylglycerol kinase family protein, partial [Weeksellaceae bacterium]
YGGDGTIIEVAKALYKSRIPLGIIPGGTANVMAKELHIPINSLDAIKLLTSRRHKIKAVDMGMCNSTPFFLRLTMGDLANMTRKTTRDLKNKFGQLAYGIAALQHLGKNAGAPYELQLDNKKFTAEGTSIMITNSGNVGIEGTSLIPSINIADGYLDVILFKNTDISTLASLAGSILMQNKPEGIIAHWKAKKIKIRSKSSQFVVHDDKITETKSLTVAILPKTLRIVVPK